MTTTTAVIDAAHQIEAAIHALTGRPLYDWQRDYIQHLIQHKAPPRLVDLPPASGKTMIALIHLLAAMMDLFDRPVRRVWLCEPTRLLVDTTATRFKDDLEKLKTSSERSIVDIRAQMGEAFNHLSGVHAFYGGASTEQRKLPRVDKYALIITTHQQVGLVLHSHRPRQWPLIVSSASLIIDESHTNPNVATAIETLLDQPAAFRGYGAQLRSFLTEMTATPVGTHASVFTRTRDELAKSDSPLRERMTATASVKIIDKLQAFKDKKATKKQKIQKFTAAVCDELKVFKPSNGHKLALVIVNTTSLAKKVYAAVKSQWRGKADVKLLIGRAREAEKTADRKLLTDLTNGMSGSRPTIYVATQTIESGVDCSADVLITECPDAAALIQRCARCNRDGKSKNAHVTIIRFSPYVYTEQLIKATWDALKSRVDKHGRRNLTVRHLDDLLSDPKLDRSKVVVCKMTPARFDVLSQSGGDSRNAMDPTAYTDAQARAEVTLVFRHLAENLATATEEWIAQAHHQISRPVFGEQTTVPLDDAVEWLGQRPVLVYDYANRRFFRRNGYSLRPFQEVIVPTTYGGLTHTGAWDTDTKDEVVDISFREHLRARGWTSIPSAESPESRRRRLLHMAASIYGVQLSEAADQPAPPNPDDYEDKADYGRALACWLRQSKAADLADLVAEHIVEDDGTLYIGPGKDGFSPPTLDDGDIIPSKPAPLDAHNAGVADRAEKLGIALKLDDILGEGHILATMLGAGLGDVGKAYDAHQRYFYGGSVPPGAPLLAKSRPSRLSDKQRRWNAGYPLSERHEVVSVTCADSPGFKAMTAELTDIQRELVKHLIVSHHGHGYPSIPGSNRTNRPAKFQVSVVLGGRTATLTCDPNYSPREQEALALERFDKLMELYGRYTLALLELIVHTADAEQSRAEQEATS